jgi:hypothetical protein
MEDAFHKEGQKMNVKKVEHAVETITINDSDRVKVYLATYSEICRSYHAIDDFRTKLLGFLPLTSLVGLFLLDTGNLLSFQAFISNEVLGFAAIFATLLTLSLFGYEIRSIKRTDHLIREGKHLEQQLGIGHGHFNLCEEEHADTATAKVFNSKVIACVIYSVVFSAWLFIALRLGFGVNTLTCYLSATIIGLVVAVGVSWWLQERGAA